MNRKHFWTLAAAVAGIAMAASGLAQEIVYIPDGVETSAWLPARRAEQLATRDDFDTFNDFSFEDIQPASGVSFLHRIVDDAGKYYKPVHYDHGNGIAVADVDSDGLLDFYIVSQAGPNGLYRNLGGGRFEDITEDAGVSVVEPIGVTASFADFDNDGDADLLTVSIDVPVALLENVQRRPARWVGLRVRGGGVVNLDGYGSRVELKLSDRDAPVPFEIRSAASYLAANDPRRSIGLGAGAQPEWARVHWPDGRRERFVELSSGRYNLLAYGEGVEEP